MKTDRTTESEKLIVACLMEFPHLAKTLENTSGPLFEVCEAITAIHASGLPVNILQLHRRLSATFSPAEIAKFSEPGFIPTRAISSLLESAELERKSADWEDFKINVLNIRDHQSGIFFLENYLDKIRGGKK